MQNWEPRRSCVFATTVLQHGPAVMRRYVQPAAPAGARSRSNTPAFDAPPAAPKTSKVPGSTRSATTTTAGYDSTGHARTSCALRRVPCASPADASSSSDGERFGVPRANSDKPGSAPCSPTHLDDLAARAPRSCGSEGVGRMRALPATAGSGISSRDGDDGGTQTSRAQTFAGVTNHQRALRSASIRLAAVAYAVSPGDAQSRRVGALLQHREQRARVMGADAPSKPAAGIPRRIGRRAKGRSRITSSRSPTSRQQQCALSTHPAFVLVNQDTPLWRDVKLESKNELCGQGRVRPLSTGIPAATASTAFCSATEPAPCIDCMASRTHRRGKPLMLSESPWLCARAPSDAPGPVQQPERALAVSPRN
ncbi:hypothetical protein VTO73DRAFT_9486 [Trametes versicolor]